MGLIVHAGIKIKASFLMQDPVVINWYGLVYGRAMELGVGQEIRPPAIGIGKELHPNLKTCFVRHLSSR